jgi:hypothetical protein
MVGDGEELPRDAITVGLGTLSSPAAFTAVTMKAYCVPLYSEPTRQGEDTSVFFVPEVFVTVDPS